jgi:exopolysaccharide production protein ExoZ
MKSRDFRLPETSNRVVAVQLLRAMAAMAVAASHVWILTYWTGARVGVHRSAVSFDGGWGVDLFFVISGIVMVYSSVRLLGRPAAKRTFIARRLVRIVPLYWVTTLLFTGWLVRTGTPVPSAELLQSLLFVPYAGLHGLGHVVPIVEPGWTLQFEMLFYGIFGLALGGTSVATVLRATTAITLLVLAGTLLTPSNAVLFTLSRPILLEFCGGMALGLLMLRGRACPPSVRLALACPLPLMIAFEPRPTFAHWQGWERLITWGVPSLCFVASAGLGPIKAPLQRIWVRLGDASYSLYLLHMPLLIFLGFFWRRWQIPFAPSLFAAAGAAIILGTSMAVFRWFEWPLTRRLNRWLDTIGPDLELGVTGV